MKENVTIFLDINETLIRTGEVALNDRLQEQYDLEIFAGKCKEIAQLANTKLVFITGNSFEYCRRIEEPIGIKNIHGLDFCIVSENGLIGRSFNTGLLWKCALPPTYFSKADLVISELSKRFKNIYFLQGNEIRITIKPTNDSFTDQQLDKIKQLFEELDIEDHFIVFYHQYYIDLDPEFIVEGETTQVFEGKKYGVNKLLNGNKLVFGIGDSSSDIDMFIPISDAGGTCFWVGNTPAKIVAKFNEAKVLEGNFTKGVIDMLDKIIKSLSTITN